MPGDMSASATTFSTVVRDGPWMCSAEMQASISRCRWRARDARSGATATGGAFPLTTLLGFFLFTPASLYRKIPHRHLSGGNHEIAGAAGPLAHHSSAAAVPHGLF